MKNIQSFYDLDVWKKAHEFVLAIYKEVQLPNEEKYILENQLNRAAISIPTNITGVMGRYIYQILNHKDHNEFTKITNMFFKLFIKFYGEPCKKLRALCG